MLAAASSIVAGALMIVAVLALPWVEGGVLLREQSRAAAAAATALVLLLLAGRGRAGGGSAPVLCLAASAYCLWHWASGTSVDGASSRETAGQLAAVATAMLVGGTLFRYPEGARVLLWGVVASASAVGVSGLIGVARADRSLAGWTAGELEVFAAPFGPFVNPNNAAALMMTGLAAAVALMATRLGGREDAVNAPRANPAEAAAAAAAAVVLTAALLAAGSRSGVACGGLAAAASVLLARRPRQGTLTAALLVAGGLLYAATRLTDISWIAEAWRRSDQLAEDARFTHGRHMLDAVAERPLFGWGPNTYGMVSRKFVPSDGVLWFEHADSQWFETLVDMGIVGLATGLAFVFVVAAGVVRRREDPAAALPVAAAGGTLVGLGLHSLFDYAVLLSGVWLPAALVLGCGSMRRPSFAWGPVAAIAAAAAGVGAWELHNAAEVQRVALAVPDLVDEASATEATVEALLDRNAAALTTRPDDSLGLWTDARLNTYLARLRMMASPPRPIAEEFRTTVWPLFEPSRLHAVAAALPPAVLDELRADQSVAGPLSAALAAARASVAAAPLRHRPRILSAELAWIDGPPRDPATALETAETLPDHAPTQEALAELAWSAGDFDLLKETLPRALSLSDRYDDRWTTRLNRVFSVPQIAEELMPADAAVLLRVAEGQTQDPDDPLRESLLARAGELLKADPNADTRAAGLGGIAILQGDRAAGETIFQERLKEQPASPQTRRALARSLLARGENRDALVEARAAVAADRMTPGDYALMKEIGSALRRDGR